MIPGAYWVPSSNQNFNLFPFTVDINKGKFGYGGFFYRITTHGWSHLSMLRESYQKMV